MSRAPHPADEATLRAIRDAEYFTLSIFHQLAHETHPLRSLAKAVEAAPLLEARVGNSRLAIIYAVTKEGRSFMVPRTLWHAPIIPTESDMSLQDQAIAAPLPRPHSAASRPYTDRSNCRKAMVKMAAHHGVSPESYRIIGEAPEFRFIPAAFSNEKITPAPDAGKPALVGPDLTAPAEPHPLDIPVGLKRTETPDEKRRRERVTRDTNERRIKNPPSRASAASKGLGMSPFAMKEAGAKPKAAPAAKKARAPAKATAEKVAKPPRKPSSGNGGKRVNWRAVAEEAKGGKMPPAPDFSAETHKRFRPALEELKAAAKASDIEALRKVKIPNGDSSMRSTVRFRDLSILAIKAKAKG